VEFFGPALDELPLPTKAMIANMAPEYGATMGFFPVDQSTLDYLRLTGRTEDEIDLIERYTKEQTLFRTPGSPAPVFTDTVELDVSTVESSLAGPKRPQDRVALSKMKQQFRADLSRPIKERGFELSASEHENAVAVSTDRGTATMSHGAVVITAITSCTNTSDPMVLITAGLLARNAVAHGLTVKPYVKTSLPRWRPARGSLLIT
jgi:aconitate hydratase